MRSKLFGAIVAALALATGPSLAQRTDMPASPNSVRLAASAGRSSQAPALTRADLGAWLDGYLPYAMKRGDVAGAVVVVVKDGHVLLQKGYGFANVATHRPVDPETTLFRPGSVSKLITWTAVMQQVEQGRIHLDQDINTYLDFRIPPFHGQPITMRNLMTHTPGFEYSLRDLVTSYPNRLPSLQQYLKDNLPPRVYPPGKVPSYSNYGAALAGYIVQRVSGQPFDDYIEQHIFAPLNIKDATYREPLPAKLVPQMAVTYSQASAPPKPYEIFIHPAGSAAITGADMGRFMIAHLQNGAYDGRSILQPQTARLMHESRLTTISPLLHRMALGFMEFNRNGHKIIGHEGDTIWFHSVLLLFPDDHVGLFASFDGVGRDGATRAIRQGLIEGFSDRYFAGPQTHAAFPADIAKADAARMTGQYDASQWAPSSFLSLGNLFSQTTVQAGGDGQITASSIENPDGQVTRFEEIAPYVWRAVGGKERLAAKLENKKVVMWAEDRESPTEVFLPTPEWRSATWLLPLLEFSLAALLLTFVLWPIGALVRRRFGAKLPLEGAAAQSYRWVRISTAAAAILMVAWLTTVWIMATTFTLSSKVDSWILALHVLSFVLFPAAVLIGLWNFWIACTTRKGLAGIVSSAWSGVLALSSCTLLWVAIVYHLIGLSRAF